MDQSIKAVSSDQLLWLGCVLGLYQVVVESVMNGFGISPLPVPVSHQLDSNKHIPPTSLNIYYNFQSLFIIVATFKLFENWLLLIRPLKFTLQNVQL